MKRTAFFLSEIQPSDGMFRVEALRVGHWDYPIDGGLNVTPDLLRELKRNFDLGAKGFEVPVDGRSTGDHENTAHSDADADDCGWVKRLELADGDTRLLAYFDLTDSKTKADVEAGNLKYCSSELDLAWFDPEDKTTKRVFEGLALTNRPYIKRMEPIQPVNLSEFAANDFAGKPGDGGTNPHQTTLQEETMAKTLEELQKENELLKVQLKEAQAGNGTAKTDEGNVKLAELSKVNEALRVQLAQVEKSNRETAAKLRLGEIKAKLAGLARKGKITVPIYKKVFALAEALVTTGTSEIKLGCKKKLEEGEEGDGVDKLDVVESVLDVLGQLPDSIATDPDKEAVLDEDSETKDEDDDEALDKEARAQMRENPKLKYRQALVLAEKKLRGGR